jgi:hypothetical protein
LYLLTHRASFQTDHEPRTCKTLVPHDTHFYRSAILGYNYERDHSAVRKIGELNSLVGLVEAEMMWQRKKLQVRAKDKKFGVGN